MDTCRTCRMPIIWAVSASSGKAMPLDVERVTVGLRYQPDAGNIARRVLGELVEGHAAHFATCPDADQHRRRRR